MYAVLDCFVFALLNLSLWRVRGVWEWIRRFSSTVFVKCTCIVQRTSEMWPLEREPGKCLSLFTLTSAYWDCKSVNTLNMLGFVWNEYQPMMSWVDWSDGVYLCRIWFNHNLFMLSSCLGLMQVLTIVQVDHHLSRLSLGQGIVILRNISEPRSWD